MRLTDDKINHLSHLISYALDDSPKVKLTKDLNLVRQAIRDLITAELSVEDKIDAIVRKRLKQRPGLRENTEEWRIIYRQEFEKELERRGQ